jgi:hypothetical protein
MTRTAVAAGAGREQDNQRAHALAAAGNDVLGDLVDQIHGAFHAGADDGIDGPKIGAN